MGSTLELGLGLPADKEILYQPDYWQDRADDLRRLAEALREETDFYHMLNRQADQLETLARKAFDLKQKRNHWMRRAPKYTFRPPELPPMKTLDAEFSNIAPPPPEREFEDRVVNLVKRKRI